MENSRRRAVLGAGAASPSTQTKAYLVGGGGIASLADAAYLIRDADLSGENIHIIVEELDVVGGSLDGQGAPEDLSAAQVEQLDRASRLVAEPVEWRYAEGVIRFDVELPPHAVAAVTLEPTMEPPDGGHG